MPPTFCAPVRSSRVTRIGMALLAIACGTNAGLAQNSDDTTRPSRDGDFSPGRGDGNYARPVSIFFPPNPPPLGRAINRSIATTNRSAAPAELAAYVNEPFYPPLGTRLASKSLSAKLRAQLEQYRSTKVALQNELRAELERLRGAEPAVRLEELTAFARRQGPQLTALEAMAEQLRRDLITNDNQWSALRQWRLGENDRRGYSPNEIGQVMRGYAFYQPGLLPAQRRLLREISLEMAAAADSATTAAAAQPYLFFPPEPARVLLPDDLPAEVAANVAAYQTRKSQLKKELYDAVYTQDGKNFAFMRNSALKTLADKQAGPLLQLEQLAEEIRRGLASVAEPHAIAERSPLPPVLQNRVAILIGDYGRAQKEATAQVEAVLLESKGLPIQANYRFDPDGLKYLVLASRAGRGAPPASKETLASVDAIRAKLGVTADAYGRQIAALVNEKNAILAEIAQALGTKKTASIDAALQVAMRVATARETEGLYSEYRFAVFQPGLSPEQRRLLFDGVIEQLDLPLPRGELQPVYRSASW